MTPDTSTIRAHYRRAAPVYQALATVREYPTIGLNDFVGWYIKRDTDDIEAIDEGYPQQGRVARLDRDLEEVIDRLDRTLYAVTTYKTQRAFQRWEPCRYDEAQETTIWQDDRPTPTHADLRAVPAWGDIDLADDLKETRDRLDEATRTRIEETLAAYVDEYAALYGTREAVYALDSVGGAYIFGAPEATLPIAAHFSDDPDARGRVFDAFLDRLDEWFADAEERVNARIRNAADVIQPDWVNNKNRQYKAPLAIHAEHDAVVTPLDPEDITYELQPLAAVDEATIERATAWAETFTRVEHQACVSTLVATLWPNTYDDHEAWQPALEEWVAAEREQHRQRQRERALRRRAERLESPGDVLEGHSITPFKQDVYDAVDEVDITEIARHHASDAYDTDPRQPRPQFDPCWRYSESGQSCFVDESANTFGDSKANDGGGPAKLMALGTGIISDAREDLDGESYWAAVDELRKAGYDIPVWLPDAETEAGTGDGEGEGESEGESPDQMPFWAVKKAAVVLDVCSQDAFVERETEDGGTYRGFPDYETYNETLMAIDDAGLSHGRPPVIPATEGKTETAAEKEDVDQAVPASTDAPASLATVHLREQNRLLAAELDRLSQTIDDQAETILRLEEENATLRAELAAHRDESDSSAAVAEGVPHGSDYGSHSERSVQPAADSVLERITRIMLSWR